MAVGPNGDVPPTFPVVMDNPGDQAGLMVHELEELQEEQEELLEELQEVLENLIQIQRQEELIWHGKLQVGIWVSIMWIFILLIYMAISYRHRQSLISMMMHIFEELENNME